MERLVENARDHAPTGCSHPYYINLLFTVDSHYLYPPLTTLVSVRKNLPENVAMKCFLVRYKDEPPADLSLVQGYLSANDILFDVPLPHFFAGFDFGRWTDGVMKRLIAIYYLPERPDRILYLDGDTIADGNVLPLYEDSTSNNYVLCVTKETLPWTKKSPIYPFLEGKEYFNAGVLLINLNLWKKHYPTMASFEKAAKNLPFVPTANDQDILNYLFRGSRYIFPDDRYMRFCDGYHYVWIEKGYKAKKAVIYHYAGPHKPWNVLGNPRYRRIFWKYGKRVYPKELIKQLTGQRIRYVLLYPARVIKRLFRKPA